MTEILPIEDINKKIEFILSKNGKKPKKHKINQIMRKILFKNLQKIVLVDVKFAMQILNITHL